MSTAADQRTDSNTSDCGAALVALSSGRLREFHGVPPGCGRATTSAVLGPSRFDEDSHGPAGPFREYGASPAAPEGLLIFFTATQDRISYVRIRGPRFAAPLHEQLGAPEAKADSRLHAFHQQHIYASRGLVAHVDEGSGAVAELYAFAPTTVQAYLQSALSRVEIHREQRRR